MKYQQLLKTLDDNDVLITATQRLASFLEHEYALIKSHEGKSVWVKPSIFSFSTWLKSTWLTIRFRDKRLLLLELQAQVLWQKIIQASEKLPITLAESLAKSASEAFNLIREWQLPFPFPDRMMSEDMHRFQNWAISFQTQCQENHWLTSADLSPYLARQFQAGELTAPKKIILIGFDELNRAYQALLQILKDLGTQVEYYADDFTANRINRLELDNVDAEVLTMAHWAKATLQNNPSNSFIGCIVPKLEQRRSLVLQTFHSVFAESDFSFDLSAPTQFDKIPLIHIVFKLFELGENSISLADVGLLLRTPFIGAANTERVARAKLDARLKHLARGEISIDSLLQLAGEANQPFYCPLWRQHVIHFRTALTRAGAKQFLPSVFAEKFSGYLHSLGWPGERQLTDDEVQIMQRFQQLLKEFASLDVICGEMTWKQAKSQLAGMAKQILFQSIPITPASVRILKSDGYRLNEFAPVQILGTLEPVGILFTHLWVLGLNDEAWPSAPRPHPFIPLELQCQFDIPHSSATRELKFSQHLTDQFYHMASQVIFSSAKQEGDVKQRPSRLLDEFPIIDLSALNLQEALIQLPMSASIEYLEDHTAPAIPLGEHIEGGVCLFELQSACPFRAFAEVRLAAKALEKTRVYLSAKERGALLHQALELVWSELKSQHRLLNVSNETIHQLVLNSVKTAMAKIYEDKLDKLTSGFNRIEQQCLVNLIEKWLFLHEKMRPDFRIAALESSEQVDLMGYLFQLKIDRIDELCTDKKWLMIDYKTGLVSKEDWFGERPNKPQLPLYCVTSQMPVSGVLFAQLKAGQLMFKGLVEEGIEIDGAQIVSREDWLNQQADWKVHLESLAMQFSHGYAKVDPKEGQKTCQFCELKMFCRVGEGKC